MRRPPAWPLLLLPLVASAAVRGWWAPDEPRYAEIARETWSGGGWLVLRLCGEVYPDKPPLVYWLAGLFDRLSGGSELWMRLPSLAATAGSAWLVALLARRWWGEREARIAPALFLSTAMVAEIGGRLQLDPLLACFILAALALVPSAGDARPRARMALAGLAVGAGMLTKGPVALAVVALVLAAWRFVPGAAPRPKLAGWPLAIALALLPVTAWATAASLAEPELARELFFGQHAGRVVAADAPHAGPIWKHATRLPLMLLPWTPLVALAAWRAWRRRELDRGERLCWAWFLALFLFFSLIPPKRDLYLLPAYPALALLGARELVRLAEGAARVPRWVAGTTMGALALLALALFAVPLAHGALPAEAFERVPGLAWRAPLVALPLAIALPLAARAQRRSAPLRWARAVAFGVGGGFAAAALFLMAPLDATKSARAVALAVAARPERPETVPCLGVKPEGYRFYGDLPAVREGLDVALAREGDVLALIERERFEALPPATSARLEIVDAQQVGSREVLVCIRSLGEVDQ